MLKYLNRKKDFLFRFSNSYLLKYEERGVLNRFDFQEGEFVGNFKVLRVFPSKEFNAIYYEFQHQPSQARFVHISTNKQNNEAVLLLYTPSFDDRGLAHMAHRLTCAGSDKFPIRDAWSFMHNRSMNPRNLQPYQASDYSLYPVQSCLLKDLYQLLDLTFEQVYNPMGRKVDFLLEGVRKQFIGNEIFAYGDVYESMKNNFCSGQFIHEQAVRNNLLKGTIYAKCGGGIPFDILDARYEDVLAYMKNYITIQNSIALTSGDLDLKSHLQYFDKKFNQYHKSNQQTLYRDENYLLDKDPIPTRLKLKYTPQENEAFNNINLSFRGADLTKNPQDYLSLGLLSYVLHEIDGFGMSQYLSNQCPRYCFNYGVDVGSRQQILNIGLATNQETKQIEQDLINILHKIRNNFDEVIPKNIINSLVRKVQLKRQVYLQDISSYVLHKIDPKFYLSQKEYLKNIDQNIQSVIKKYLFSDFTTVICEIDNDAIYENGQTLKKKLNYFFKGLSDKQIQEISEEVYKLSIKYINQTQLVKDEQEKIQTLDSLPIMKLTDTLPLIDKLQNTYIKLQYDIPLTIQPQRYSNTSNIFMSFEITEIPDEDLKFINLIKYIIPHLHQIAQHPGELFSEIIETNDNRLLLIFQFEFSEQNCESALQGMVNSICDPAFDDHSKISELLNVISSQIGNEVVEKAVKYAIDQSSSIYGVRQFSLLDQSRALCDFEVKLLKNLNIKPLLNQMTNDLIKVYFKIMNKNKIKFFSSTNPSMQLTLETHLNLLISTLKLQFESFLLNESEFNQQYEVSAPKKNQKSANQKIYYVIPSGINYVSESIYVGQKFGNQLCPVYHVMSSLLTEFCLLQYSENQVYQISCKFNIFTGVLTFFSYRDPNILKSFQVFERSIHDLIDGVFDAENLEQAKITLLRKIYSFDKHYNLNEFIHGIDEQTKGAYLKSLALVTREEIQLEAQKILKILAEGLTSQVILGSQSKALDDLIKRGWLIVRALEDISVRPESYEQNQQTYYEFEEDLR